MVSEDTDDAHGSSVSRRKWLAIAGGATAGLAGCMGDGGGSPTPSEAESTETSATSGETTSPETSTTPGEAESTETSATSGGATGAEGQSTSSDGTQTLGEPVDPRLDFPMLNRITWAVEETNLNPFGLGETTPGSLFNWVWNNHVNRWITGREDGPEGRPMAWMLKEPPQRMGDGCSVKATFREDMQWYDGTEYTAEDQWMQLRIENYVSTTGNLGDATTRYELLPEENAIVSSFATPINETLANNSFVTTAATKRTYWREWLERFQDATSQSETESIIEELSNLTISLEEFRDEGLGTGLWKPTSWDSQGITSTIVEDHPFADRTNLTEIRAHTINDDQKFLQTLASDNIDFGTAYNQYLSQISGSVRENYEQLYTRNTPYGSALKFSFRNQHLRDRRVRHAIAHLVSLEDLATLIEGQLNYSPRVSTQQTAMPSDAVAQQWLGQDWIDNNLVDYGTQRNEQRATELMQEAGYTKQGGSWVDEEGNSISDLVMLAFKRPTFSTIAQPLAQTLSDFGIGTTFISTTSPNFFTRVRESNDFDMLLFAQANNSPVPERQYRLDSARGIGAYHNYFHEQVEWGGSVEGCQQEVRDHEFIVDRTVQFKRPVRPKLRVPPIGADRLTEPAEDEDHWKFNPITMNAQLGFRSGEEMIDVTKDFAWYSNWEMPMVCLWPRQSNSWLDTQNFYEREGALTGEMKGIGSGNYIGRTEQG